MINFENLHLHAYKIQLTQELHPEDHAQRRTFFGYWSINKSTVIFRRKSSSQLGGYVTNCRIWGTENPQVIQQLPMHPPRVIVWYEFWVGGVIGPYFSRMTPEMRLPWCSLS